MVRIREAPAEATRQIREARAEATRKIPRTPFLALVLASCATTTLVGNTWRAQAFTGPPLRRVLICALSPDDVTRALLEDAFAHGLPTHGVSGVTCGAALPPGPRVRQQVRDAAASGGYDGIIVAMPASTKQVKVYQGDDPERTASIMGTGWDIVYQADYLKTETEVTIEVRAYSVPGSGGAIWGGTSETFAPSSMKSLVSQVVPGMIDAMARVGILPPRSGQPAQ